MKYFSELMEANKEGLSKIYDVSHWNDKGGTQFSSQAGAVAMQGSDGEFYLGYDPGSKKPNKLYITQAGLQNPKLMTIVKSYKVKPLAESAEVEGELLQEARHGRRLVAQRDAIIIQVMKEILHFGSVDQTGQDHLDFKQVSVWNVKRALSVAFDKGYKYAQVETETKSKNSEDNPDPNGNTKDTGTFESTSKGSGSK
jgi:hypothetical protein